MALPALPLSAGEQGLHELMDDARGAMEDTMDSVRDRCRRYLNWYSPPWDTYLGRHDAWETVYDRNDDQDTTRSNFPISRAVVDIWTSLEAAKPPLARAEPEHLSPPMPQLDEGLAALAREQYVRDRRVQAIRAEIRGRHFREMLRRDLFPLKAHRAVRRKNLYGFSWMMVLPDPFDDAPRTVVLRNPTTVYPLWSTRDPDELDAVLSVQQVSAVQANQKWGLGLVFEDGRVSYQQGGGLHDRYSDVNEEWYYSEDRTKVWVEDFWWADREYDESGLRVVSSKVHCAKRVCGRVVDMRDYDWRHLPFVYWQNEDERHWSGWSEVAGVMDINDDFNRRLSGESDVLGMYENPRFQLIGGYGSRDDIEMPRGGELLTDLQDPERIEQILARVDVYPNQVHLNMLIEMLHRVTGLPPIVWGLIANAQTSGRALSASWKATEARLVPKLMANTSSIRRYADIVIDYAHHYDWRGGERVWRDRDGRLYDDIRWTFPPMEPRDFQEVTMDAITRRDAGLTTTVMAMRDTGEENAEERLEEIRQEFRDPTIHPDRAQAQLLYRDAEMQLLERMAAMGGQMPQPHNPATVQQAVGQARAAGAAPPAAAPAGAEAALPPTQPGAPGNAGQPVPPQGAGAPPPGAAPEEMVTTGTLVRGGDTSNQILRTTRVR